jgi:hypothetical protein
MMVVGRFGSVLARVMAALDVCRERFGLFVTGRFCDKQAKSPFTGWVQIITYAEH